MRTGKKGWTHNPYATTPKLHYHAGLGASFSPKLSLQHNVIQDIIVTAANTVFFDAKLFQCG